MWINRPLGEVCEILDNLRKPRSKRDRKSGEIPYYGSTGVVDWVDDFIFNEKLVLVGEDGAKWKRGDKTAFIINGKAWVNNHAHVLRPYDGVLIHEWLEYYLTSIDLSPWVHGATVPKLNQTQLRSIPIPIPPLSEQQRIVAKLDAAFVEIDEAVSVVEAKEIEVQQLKASLLSKVIDDQSTNLTPLGEVVKIARGGSPRPIKSFITDDDNGVNWIKIGDTEQGGRYIYRTKEKIKPSGVSRSRFVKEDDFLLSNSMSFGRPYILKTSGCIHDGWLVLSEYQKLFSSDYLYYLLSSSYVQNQFEFLAKGSTVRNLNIDLVSKVLVPIPSLEHQKKISEKLDFTSQKFEEYKHSILKNQMNYKLLKSSILSKEIQSGIAA